MRFEDLKQALGSSLSGDVDALWGSFCQDTGTEDLTAFVEVLANTSLVDAATAEQLRNALANDDEPTAQPNIPVQRRPSLPQDDDTSDDERAEEQYREMDTGTYALAPDGSNTNPAGAAPQRERRTGTRQRVGERQPTGERRKLRATGETETSARKRQAQARQAKKTVAIGDDAIAGKGYEFVGQLGEGAMGAVLKARDLDLNRVVAFKTMSAEIAASPMASKFIGEAQITAQLEHPNIIPIYSLDATAEGNLAYAMKMVRGKTFEDIILECRDVCDNKHPDSADLALSRRLELFLDVCDAVHYANERGVVHRDLKPENIMVGPYGEVYVMDWGISKVYHQESRNGEQPVTLTRPADSDGELIIGTPQYMSPEQAHGLNDELDGYSDQYALGLILYELICLQQAVTGKAPLKIVMRQQDGEKNPMVHYKHGQAIPTELKAIALKACSKDKGDRYPSVAALGEDLRRYLRGEQTIAKPDNLVQKMFRFLNSHREMTALAIMGSFTMLASLVIATLIWSAYQSTIAHAREERIGAILTAVASQSAKIDGTFVHYEGLLGVVRATATDMLTSGQMSPDEVYWGTDYDANRAPKGMVDSARYGMPIHNNQPAYVLADKVNKNDVAVALQRLEPMRRHYRDVLLRSMDEKEGAAGDKRAERLIGELGVPVAWVHIGTESGLYSGFPGHGGYPPQWDARDRPWYDLARNKKIPTWGSPYPDYFGLGAILPCAIGLYDVDGSFMGVAAVEITFDYIIDKLLVMNNLFTTTVQEDTRAEYFLVDNEGRIVVRSSKKNVKVHGGQLKARPLRNPPLEYPEVVEHMNRLDSGGYLEQGDDIVFYNRLNATGWYYVVSGKTSTMLNKDAQ